MLTKILTVLGVAGVAAVVLIFAAWLEAVEQNEELRRWERRCNRKYRDDPDAVLGR